MKKHLSLFLTFLKIGAFTFGGGYAMLALLENEFVEKKKWIGQDEFIDMVAIAESTPGPVAINSATFIGYRVAGVLGSALSTLAVSLPSLFIIYAISLFFDAFLSLTYVAYAFKGIRVAVVYLIASAGIRLFKALPKKCFERAIFLGTLLLMVGFSLFSVKFSAVFYVLIAGLLGVISYGIGKTRHREDTK